MPPKLVACAGPLKGSVFPLADRDVSIGRASGNRIPLDDPAAGERHCVIVGEADRFKLQGLDGRYPTFINGVPADDQILRHGDQIRIGDSLFMWFARDSERETAGVVMAEEIDLSVRLIIELRREDILHSHVIPDRAAPVESRTGSDLLTLLRISTAVSAVEGLVGLHRPLLELILEALPAERGALLVAAESSSEIASSFGLHRRRSAAGPVQVNRRVAERVLREGIALLGENGAEGSGATSFVMAPMLAFDRIVGAIYLETADTEPRLDAGHLHLLAAVGGVAAVAMEHARHREWLEMENRRLRAELEFDRNMVGDSAAIRAVYQRIARVAPTNSTVLIRGESGTGKELAARAIHRSSLRAEKPFVPINCAALTESLLETELFGHEKGAFTGAICQKKGKLEMAAGGTVFLDEVAELSTALQAKLLRVLQEREFERVGGTRPVQVDFRLIAATNRNLEEAVRAGTFRQDLYYRIDVVSLALPPLRERREDIPRLVEHFARKHGLRAGRRITGCSPEALACLCQYDWPGNVRELENLVERAVVLGTSDRILPEDLSESVLEAGQDPVSLPAARYHDALNEAKKALILGAFETTGGDHAAAARLLGLHPNYLHRLVRNLQLKARIRR